MSALYRRRAGVTERVIGSQVFLANPDTGSLYRLNSTGSALWRLLAEPIGLDEAVAVFGAAFPDRSADEVRMDILGLIEALLEETLAEEAALADAKAEVRAS